jgi:hypothetical protein
MSRPSPLISQAGIPRSAGRHCGLLDALVGRASLPAVSPAKAGVQSSYSLILHIAQPFVT